MIGGDDNYKENEQDESFLSQWAWTKICPQFTEDDMNGVKSFIFSWDESHNPIHEEALQFYLDPTNSGQKFVPRPRPPKPIESPPEASQDRQLPPGPSHTEFKSDSASPREPLAHQQGHIQKRSKFKPYERFGTAEKC